MGNKTHAIIIPGQDATGNISFGDLGMEATQGYEIDH